MATPRRAVASWACRCLTSRLIPCSVTPCTAYHAAKLLSRANQLLLNSAPPAGDGRGRNPARGGRLQAPPRGRSPRRRHHRRRPSEGLQRQARHQSRAREPPPKAASHRRERASKRATGRQPCSASPRAARSLLPLPGSRRALRAVQGAFRRSMRRAPAQLHSVSCVARCCPHRQRASFASPEARLGARLCCERPLPAARAPAAVQAAPSALCGARISTLPYR